ncbi:hypothetical protein C8R43DRAFT_956887 [Mycena crocata]|nr:hypothetical protein C8R43DRAFT_956887 [Mycena crocata]
MLSTVFVPPEVLSEIILWDVGSTCDGWYDVQKRRLQLAGVSKRMQAVVHGTADLWRVVAVHPRMSLKDLDTSVANTRSNVAVLFLFGGFAGMPRSYTASSCRSVPELHAELLPRVAVLFTRVARLEIHGGSNEVISRTLHLLGPYAWDELTEVKLLCSSGSGVGLTTPFVLSEPSTLEICGLHPATFKATLLANLTVLHVGALVSTGLPSATDVMAALGAAANLEVLQLVNVRFAYVPAHQTVTLPRLTHFLFQFCSVQSIRFAGLLRLPSLTNLCVRATSGECTLGQLYAVAPTIFLRAAHVELWGEEAEVDDTKTVLGGMGDMTSLRVGNEQYALTILDALSEIQLSNLRLLVLPGGLPVDTIGSALGMWGRFHKEFKVETKSKRETRVWTMTGNGPTGVAFAGRRSERWVSLTGAAPGYGKRLRLSSPLMSVSDNLDIFPDEVLDEILYEAFWSRSNPRYWDSITVLRSTPASCLQMWLDKTSSCDLTLRIHAGHCDSTRGEEGKDTPIVVLDLVEFHSLLLSTLGEAAGRTYSLHVSGATHADTVLTMDVLARLGLGRVRNLKLHNWRHRADCGENFSIPLMSTMRTLVLEGMEALCLGKMMFSSVTILRLGRVHEPSSRPHATHTLHALAVATNSVVLHLDDVADRYWGNTSRVLLPSLEDLWMVSSDEAALSLVGALDVPRLLRFRCDLQGDLRLGQLHTACYLQLKPAKTVELCMDDASDAEMAELYATVNSAHVLDFRCSGSSMGRGILVRLAADSAAFAHLRVLRLAIHTSADVRRDILLRAGNKWMDPAFLLTTGIPNMQQEPDKRWLLSGEELKHEHYVEVDVGGRSMGRWINARGEEYLD